MSKPFFRNKLSFWWDCRGSGTVRPGCYEANWLPQRIPLLLLSLHHVLPPTLQAEIGSLLLDLQKCELKKSIFAGKPQHKVFRLRCFIIAMKDKLWRITVGHSSSSVLTKRSVYFLLMSLINGGSGREVGSGKHIVFQTFGVFLLWDC